MEEEEDGEMGTPFWVQSTTNVRRVDRFRRGLLSLIFSSGVLLFILLVTAVFFMVFVIPTTIHTAHLHFFRRSNAVMKNWDSVNLVLVLVALFFGFISRNNRNYNNVVDDEVQSTTTSDGNQGYYNYQYPRNNSASSSVVAEKSASRWDENDSDRRDYSSSSGYNYYYAAANSNNSPRLRRNSTSYPDLHLRQQNLSSPSVDYYNVNDQRRFYDDSPVYYRRPSWKQPDTTIPADYNNIPVKNIYVDENDAVNSKPEGQVLEETSYVSPLSYSPLPPSPPPAPPPPPRRRATEQKAKKMHESLPHEHHTNKDVRVADSEVAWKSAVPPPPPPPPPRPPPSPLVQHLAEKRNGSGFKMRNAGKDQNFLKSYYQKKKKKRQRQKSADNLDDFFHQSQVPKTYTMPPPPPPPPPPPRHSSSVFHNLFSSKKAKRRKIPSDLHTPPPPPPPPPPPQFKTARISKPKPNIQTPTTYRPPIPVKIKSFNSFDDNSSSGGSSPLHSIPPPPPLLPFKIPEWKHVVKGDYVSIESIPSSRSGSPDTDEADNFSPEADATASPVSMFCPSPDVDTKADNFIARFRAGLKLEKIDSFNKKQVSRMSNLGPGSGPSQD